MFVFKYKEEQTGFLLPGLPVTPKTPHNPGGSANSCQTSYHYKKFPRTSSEIPDYEPVIPPGYRNSPPGLGNKLKGNPSIPRLITRVTV